MGQRIFRMRAFDLGPDPAESIRASGHVSGLFDAAQLPLALMVSADQVPFCFADIGRPRHKAGLLDPRSDPVCHHFSSTLQICSLCLFANRLTTDIPSPQNLIPPPPHTLKLPPPIPSAGGADVRWRTVRSGPVQQARGHRLPPRQCCRQRENVGVASGQGCNLRNGGGQTVAPSGAAKAASATTKEMGRTRPAPRMSPLGRQSREARPRTLAPQFFFHLGGKLRQRERFGQKCELFFA